MYELINSHVERLLGTIDSAADIDPYVWMLGELPTSDVSRSRLFQQEYCRYWALNGAGLGPAFRAAYFSLLEQSKKSPADTTVESVARQLFAIPVNSTEKKAVQFSFASKLVHMLNPHLPVYDRMVEAFYFLPRSYAGRRTAKSRIFFGHTSS